MNNDITERVGSVLRSAMREAIDCSGIVDTFASIYEMMNNNDLSSINMDELKSDVMEINTNGQRQI
jgi:hypothetical protein